MPQTDSAGVGGGDLYASARARDAEVRFKLYRAGLGQVNRALVGSAEDLGYHVAP